LPVYTPTASQVVQTENREFIILGFIDRRLSMSGPMNFVVSPQSSGEDFLETSTINKGVRNACQYIYYRVL
jgi:hypothetical protein